jgi:hypothetical protein
MNRLLGRTRSRVTRPIGVPRHAHLAVRVAGVEEPDQLGAAVVVESFVGLGQQPTASVERIVLAPIVRENSLAPGSLISCGWRV